MAKRCPRCDGYIKNQDSEFCEICGVNFATGIVGGENHETINKELQERSKKQQVFTTSVLPDGESYEYLGLVFGAGSKVALGLNTQSDRLEIAYSDALANLKLEAAKLGADGIIGVQFALNNSTGSSAALGGSSEAVMLLGTAFKYKK